MLNFRKISADCKGELVRAYFTQDVPESPAATAVDVAGRELETGARLTSYYTGRDARASWRPDMPAAAARAIGIDPAHRPKDAELDLLFEGKRADDGAAWSQHKRQFSGFDLVFSPHKSVSLAAEFASTTAERAGIWNAVGRANDAAMEYLAREIGWARKGKGGQDGADAGEVAWVTFMHDSARPTLAIQDGTKGATYLVDAQIPGDPHLHAHNFLMNMVATDDGRVGSLDTRVLSANRINEFDAFFQAVLADELRKLGAKVGYNAGEQAVAILSIPELANKTFSKSHDYVLRDAKSYAASQGLDWDGLDASRKHGLIREASDAGRLAKTKEREHVKWREEAKAIGWEHSSVMGEASYKPLSDAERHAIAYEFAAKALAKAFENNAVLERDALRMYAARGLIATGVADGPKDIDDVAALLEERGAVLKGEHVAFVVAMSGDKLKAATTAQIRIEQTLIETARLACRDRTDALPTQAIRAAMARIERHEDIAFTNAQKAAIYAMGQSGRLTLLTGVAGAGKTTLLAPLVAAWKADTRFDLGGRDVVGVATAWRQADALRDEGALKDAQIEETIAFSPLLAAIDKGEFQPTRNTVLVLDEVSQVSLGAMLKLLALQAKTGMTIKALGDREQCQSIEAGDTIELLQRVLPKSALPQLLTSVRQKNPREREIAGLFRDGKAAEAFAMKRMDGTAELVGGDYDQVVAKIAQRYIERRDHLLAAGARRGITVTALTNEEVGAISHAIRAQLKAKGEIGQDETIYQAVSFRGDKAETFDLPIATGDRLRLFRRTWATIDGRGGAIGNNGEIVEVMGKSNKGLLLRNQKGRIGEVEWHRMLDATTKRLQLGFGYAFTVDAAQGVTSDEHINAMAHGSAGANAFKTYVPESRARGVTYTMIAEAPEIAAIKRNRGLGDITPITEQDLWTQIAQNTSAKPYKELAVDLLGAARRDRERAIDFFIRASYGIERLALSAADVGRTIRDRLKAEAIRATLIRHIPALDHAIHGNSHQVGAAGQAIVSHLDELRKDATAARRRMEEAAAPAADRQSAEPDGATANPAPAPPIRRRAPAPGM